MEILIKLFLLIYLLIIALVTILSVIWILTSIFTFESAQESSIDDNRRKHV